ncbi:MAG: hypothetical protein A3E83_01760 [Gammaproteobacteria bacterium RIFCSPHIGHO2_12_FULL_41_20]|nr:MAG: hypothetical protein A3E83_01760 [Gammaproteobacteria bacterium RIFCSPHIGHO2_12_FULL_41_20]
MRAIILVGGLGTRLQSVVPDLPKPMAPIRGKPFLAYLVDYLKLQGITSILFPVHHLREKIQDYFQDSYAGLSIDYVVETEPLGTGGAIVNALAYLPAHTAPVFVLNGDTFVKLNYRAMYAQAEKQQAPFTMALRLVQECSRYGKAIVENDRIIGFREKGGGGPGLINSGIYLIRPQVFSSFTLPKQFSIEHDFLFPYAAALRPLAFITQDYFIDIGIPEDYARAQAELCIEVGEVSEK